MSFAARLDRLNMARLDELRSGLARVTSAPTRVRVESRLPFDALPDALSPDGGGTVYRRRHVSSLTESIGSVELGAALAADPLVLSLLALTPELAGCRMERALFLDIETIGLGNGTGNYAFLIGVAFFGPLGLELEQYLLRDPGDEEPMLRHLAMRIEAADFIVSYNGKSFDAPVIRARFVIQRLAPLPGRPHLDLLHVARRVHKTRSFRKALSTLERLVLGYRRGPDVSGAEVAARYMHFLRTGDDGELNDVVAHNERDVITLVALTGLYGESLVRLPAEELAAVALVMKRAGDLDRARDVADEAVRRATTSDAVESVVPLRVRAIIAKARGDRDRALADFEDLATQVDDPRVRLELAKLYEHYLKDPGRALAAIGQHGTGEPAAAEERRRSRLLRKLVRSHPVPGWARVGR